MAKKKTKKAGILNKQVFNSRWVYLVLALVTFSIYANTLTHDYTLDDAILITENIFTKKGFSGLTEIFTHDTFYGFFQEEGKDRLVSGGRYRPLSHAMFAIEYQLFGQQPWVGHLVNVLCYVFVVCSIFFVTAQIGRNILQKETAIVFGSLVAILFAIHPIHTEVVANIKSRDEILVLAGSIWSLYFAFRYLDSGRLKYGLLSGISMFGALLAKENAISFLGVIPLTVFFFRSKAIVEIVRSVLPAFIATCIYLILRISVLGFDFGDDPPRELMNNPFLKLVEGRYEYMTFNEKYPMIIYGLGKYIQLLFFPHPLTHDYYPKFIDHMHWMDPGVLLSMLAGILLLLICLLKWKEWRIVSFSILFFGMTIFLTSNILFPIGTHLSERFLFIPSISYALVISAFICWIRDCYNVFTALLILSVFTIPHLVKTINRNQVWKNNYELFTTDVITSAGSAKARNAAGGALIAHALTLKDTSVRNQEIRQAIGHLNQAIQIHPGYKNAFLLIGNAQFYLKQYELAISYYDRALSLDPVYSEAIYNRAVAQRDLGRFYGESLGDLDRAIEFLQKAYPELQDDYETNRLLGIAFGNRGEPEKAIPYFKKALAQKTDDAWTNYNLGLAYLAIQDSINANHYIGIAKTLNPEVGR